jgi:hypothetical protein
VESREDQAMKIALDIRIAVEMIAVDMKMTRMRRAHNTLMLSPQAEMARRRMQRRRKH